MSLMVERARSISDTGVTRGVGLAVVNPDGQLWVQRDVVSRKRTGRRGGALSIAFETAKVHEGQRENVLGALAEVMSDRDLPTVGPNLLRTDAYQSSPSLAFQGSGSNIEYSLAIAVYDGGPTTFTPHAQDEASPVGWMNPEELLDMADVRPIARHAVHYMLATDLIGRKLGEHWDDASPLELFVPEGFVIAEYHADREKQEDMVPDREYDVA